MAQSFEFYHARAEESAAEADTAALDNVRERALRSEKTWRGLAEQARKVEIDREKAKEVRRQRIEAEEAVATEEAADAVADES